MSSSIEIIDYFNKVVKYLKDPKIRLFIYSEYLKYINDPSHIYGLFICNKFSELIHKHCPNEYKFQLYVEAGVNKHRVDYYIELSLKKAFPEIVKPKNTLPGEAWFAGNEKVERIKIIEKAIKKLKTKYNLE